MLNRNAVEKIYSLLVQVLPEDWTRVVLWGQVKGTFSQFDCYFRCEGSDAYTRLNDLAGQGRITQQQLRQMEKGLYLACARAQKEIEKGLRTWTGFTLAIRGDGSFAVDYEYPREDADPAAFTAGVTDAWKQRYLI